MTSLVSIPVWGLIIYVLVLAALFVKLFKALQ
jgi:hypothetical protein